MLLVLLIAVPASLGTLALLARDIRVHLGVLLAIAVCHVAATLLAWTGRAPSKPFAALALDTTGLLFLSITSVLFLAASLYSVPYLLEGTHDPQAAPRRFVPCLAWFLSAMTLVAATRHLAVLWAAVEATTLASAPLVYFYRRRGALEAAWKYLLICSVGIALALLGTFFLGIAASAAPGGSTGLALDTLFVQAPAMARPWLRAAFVLALVGYGTKMGLVPMHTWLPDTHSQAPSPVSALLSGTLLNCALLAILRFYQVCLASGDAAFARELMLLLGLGSIGVAAALMIGQRDYKRLFAYSSIENMGVVAVGVGVGGGATYGALLHAVNHSMCKAGLFFVAGNVLRHFGTTRATDVRGVLGRLPWTGVLLAALLLAIGGTPPFGLFLSELSIFRAALQPHPIVAILFVSLLGVGFLGMAGVVFPMLQGGATDKDGDRPHEAVLSIAPPLVLAAAVLGLGLWIPRVLTDLLVRAAAGLGGPG